MASIRISTLLLPLLLASPAWSDEVATFELDLKAVVHVKPNAKGTAAGPLSTFAWQPLLFTEIPGKPDWRKVTSTTGASAYVAASALKKIEIKPGFGVRETADTGGKRVGSTGKTNIIYTGAVVKDSKGASWKEVWSDGKRAYVADAATIITPPTKTAPPTAKPIARPAALASVPSIPLIPTKPASSVSKLSAAPAPAPAIVAPKPVDPDCISTPEQYASSVRIKAAFGTNSPFAQWESRAGTLQPVGNKWILTLSPLAMMVMSKRPESPQMPIPLKICVDKGGRPFINMFNENKYFDDDSKSSISVNYDGNKIDFRRANVSR